MQGTQKLGGRLLGSMHTFWAPFPWRSTFFKNIPQIRQNANKSGIFGHLGGHMLKRGTARGKNNFYVPMDLMYFQKKGGIEIITFEEKVFMLGKIACE